MGRQQQPHQSCPTQGARFTNSSPGCPPTTPAFPRELPPQEGAQAQGRACHGRVNASHAALPLQQASSGSIPTCGLGAQDHTGGDKLPPELSLHPNPTGSHVTPPRLSPISRQSAEYPSTLLPNQQHTGHKILAPSPASHSPQVHESLLTSLVISHWTQNTLCTCRLCARLRWGVCMDHTSWVCKLAGDPSGCRDYGSRELMAALPSAAASLLPAQGPTAANTITTGWPGAAVRAPSPRAT